MEQALAQICTWAEEAGGVRHVVTADASAIMMAAEDKELREIIEAADLVTPDSAGVVWAMERAGASRPQRVSGADLLDALCASSADRGFRIFFLGAAPGVAERAAEKMRLRHPGVRIVGTRHGFFPAESDSVVAAEVAAAKPDILFVAMGIPRQEKFIHRNAAVLGAKVAMGVGGSLDVYSGKTRRAPKLLQRMRLEWLWRLVLNPRKAAKVRLLPGFVWRVLRSKG